MAVSFHDESEAGFGWISDNPAWMGRSSHALAADGEIWLIDPVDFAGLDERLSALGKARAVVQLFERHRRDATALGARLGVPVLAVPDELPGSPFELITVPGVGRWSERALWWPERRTLVVAEAVGTARYYCAPGRPLGVHPLLRFWRPPGLLLEFEPEHVLCGHGAGLHVHAAEALAHAVRHARTELPALVPRLLGAKKHPAL